MDLVEKYIGEAKLKWERMLGGQNQVPPKQQKAIDNMKKKGFHIVIWEPDFVAMMDKKRNPAEVYKDGTIKYPKKRIREALDRFWHRELNPCIRE